MAAKTVLNLGLVVEAGREVEAARAMKDRLRAAEWDVLRQLAAELVALGESAALGERVLVVPAREWEAEAREISAALRVAGRE